jgi:Bacterial dnaA protein helix-turn-helix
MGFQNSTPPRPHPGTGTPATPVVPLERVRRRPALPPSAAPARDASTEQRSSPPEGAQPVPAGKVAGLPPGASFDDMLALYRESTKSLREPVKHIIERVASAHGMLPVHLTGDQRAKAFVRARYAAIAEVRRIYPEKSLPWLGRQFNRDHTTILHALRKMDRYP